MKSERTMGSMRNGKGKGARPPLAPQKSSKSHATSTKSLSEVPHLVRVTVLGLSGIIVNNNKKEPHDTTTRPSDQSKNHHNHLEPEVPLPEKLRAFVSLSRNSTIVANSVLSDKLERSHKHEIVGTNSEGGPSGADAFEISEAPLEPDCAQTYEARWTEAGSTKGEEDDFSTCSRKSLSRNVDNEKTTTTTEYSFLNNKNGGNVITFETKLSQNSTGSPSISRTSTQTAAASDDEEGGGDNIRYVPKSFEVTVGLALGDEEHPDVITSNDVTTTKDNTFEPRYGLPLGVATLAIGGDERLSVKQNGAELPILNLSQVHPTIDPDMDSIQSSQSNGNSTTNLILLSGKSKPPRTEKKPLNLKKKRKKKKSGWKIFGKKKTTEIVEEKESTIDQEGEEGEEGNFQRPNSKEVDAFNSMYAFDASCGDAVLRVKIEVLRKGPDGQYRSSENRHKKAFYELTRNLTPDIALADDSDDEVELDLIQHVNMGINDDDSVSTASDSDHSGGTGGTWDTMSTFSTLDTNATNESWATMHDAPADIVTTQMIGEDNEQAPSLEEVNHCDGEKTPEHHQQLKEKENGLNYISDDDGDDDDVDDEISADDTHVTLKFGNQNYKLYTPNPVHIIKEACHQDNYDCLTQKGSSLSKFCNTSVFGNSETTSSLHGKESIIETKGIEKNAKSPQGVADLDGVESISHSLDEKGIPKTLTFNKIRTSSLRETVINAFNTCQSPGGCREKFHTDPIEIPMLKSRSGNSLFANGPNNEAFLKTEEDCVSVDIGTKAENVG